MPRIINTEGIPEGQVKAFMQTIVDYEQRIGAELDDGHIDLARIAFIAGKSVTYTHLENAFLDALAKAGIVQLAEGTYRLVPAVPTFDVSITPPPTVGTEERCPPEVHVTYMPLGAVGSGGGPNEFAKFLQSRVLSDGAVGPGGWGGPNATPPISPMHAATASIKPIVPINMVLFCPSCGVQHIDELMSCPDEGCPHYGTAHSHPDSWTNPPHRSHLCGSCGHIWRPADVPTNGVHSITTRGKNDTPNRGGGATAINMRYVNPPPLDGPLRSIAAGGGGGPNATPPISPMHAARGTNDSAAEGIDFSIKCGDIVYKKSWGDGVAPLEVVDTNWALRAAALKLAPRGGIVVWPAEGLSRVPFAPLPATVPESPQ